MATLRALFIGYFLVALFAGWPIVSVIVAGSIASWNGCTLHEGFANPCVVGGKDLGGTLYAMGVMGWFMIATIPLGAISGLLWTITWIILKRRRMARAGS